MLSFWCIAFQSVSSGLLFKLERLEDKFDDTGDENEISLESDSDEENIGKKMNNYVDTLLELPDETPDIPNDEFEKKKNDIFGASCDLSSLS